MRILLTLCLILCCDPAFACFVLPKQQVVPADELINRTNNIVLAKAVKAEFVPYPQIDPFVYNDKGQLTVAPGTEGTHKPINYTFAVIEVLKGDKTEKASVRGQRAQKNYFLSKQTFHQEEEFWKDNAGRLYNAPDCQIHPSFVLGGIYLLFLDEPYHRKSFELIGYMDKHISKDKWLAYVKEKVAE